MVRIGIIGTGTYGKIHLDALTQRQMIRKDIELVGFAEIDEARRGEVERTYGVPGYASHTDLLERARLDAVTVVTPDHLHFTVVSDVLEAGIPVLVEKPFATTVEEAEAMRDLARRKGVLCQIDFHKRFDPYHIDLKYRIQDGELGLVQYGYCWMEDVLSVGTTMIGKKSWEDQGSPAWFLGIHMIDLSYWLMGCPRPTNVYATGFKGKLASLGIEIYDSVKATVTYENGVVITYDTSVILPENHESIVRQGLKLVGTEGFMEVNSQYRGARGCSTRNGMETPNLGMKYRRSPKRGVTVTGGYLNDSIDDFVDNVRLIAGGVPLAELENDYATPEQGVETTRIGVAIHESARTGSVVHLNDGRK